MKKILIFSAVALASLMLASCGGTKDVTKGRQEITIPCGDKATSNKEYFRASSSATSKDMAMAREKALTLTKQRLASLIESTMKSVTERYANDMDAGGGSEFEQTFQNMTKEVINLELRDVAVTCEKMFEAQGGGYEVFTSIEVNKETFYNGVDKGISKDKKLEVMYDREKFRKIYEEEMAKME
ncbi:MAG: hypothetical protein MJ069_07385 [Salinivirgaceae bacterium]|nr:hypothetical protein [Salinivirgaceae bacterium]